MDDAAKKYYEAALRRSREAWNRKKQAKIDAGEYRGRGRPRKNPAPPTPSPSSENPEVAVDGV